MKKTIALLLINTCSLTFISNSFGMLTKTYLVRTTATHKKIHSFCADTMALRLQRVQVVRAREKIKSRNNILKENNNILMECITEQNKVIDQIEEWNSRPMTEFEYHVTEYDKMTALAQRLLELEQQKGTLLS